MTFTPGVPFDGQSLLNSKPMVRGNFTALNDTIDVNHYEPGANQGKHRKAVFIDDSSTTGTAVNEIAQFPKTYDSTLQLMYRPSNTANNADMWPACPMIRAYGRFDGNALVPNGPLTPIGSALNLTATKNSSTSFTITITNPFPIGAIAANQVNYIPFVQVYKAGSLVNYILSALSSTGFSFTATGSSASPDMIIVLLLGG